MDMSRSSTLSRDRFAPFGCERRPPDAKRLAIYVNLAFVRAMLGLVHGSPFGGRRRTRLPNGVVNACLTGLCLKCRMPLPLEWVSKLNRL